MTHRDSGVDYMSIWTFSDSLNGCSSVKLSVDVLNRVIILPRHPGVCHVRGCWCLWTTWVAICIVNSDV